MERIFTSSVIAEIVRRATGGARAHEIARDLGLNLGSLRVKASSLGISLRQRKAEVALTAVAHGELPLRVGVSRRTLAQLRTWGTAKGLSAEALASKLLTIIAADGLCAAILDDDATSRGRAGRHDRQPLAARVG